MRIKIISDGTKQGTQIIDESTNQPIDNCVRVQIELDSHREITNATLYIINVPVEYQGEAEIINA